MVFERGLCIDMPEVWHQRHLRAPHCETLALPYLGEPMSLLLFALACASPNADQFPAIGTGEAGYEAAESTIQSTTLDLLGDKRGLRIESSADIVHMYGAARLGDRVLAGGAGEVRLTNLGTETLHLGAPETDGTGIEVGSLPEQLEPGETTELALQVEAGAGATIRFSTNDPDLGEVELPVHSGTGVELSVGQTAPPVRVVDIDGITRDRELVGRPVVLAFFATWCPICPPELDDLQVLSATLDAEIWLVASEDSAATLETFRQTRGITLPIIVDEGGQLHDRFRQVSAFEQTLYPQNWIVGVDGTIVYAANHYEPEAITAAVESL
jgi:peroxiredoxin